MQSESVPPGCGMQTSSASAQASGEGPVREQSLDSSSHVGSGGSVDPFTPQRPATSILYDSWDGQLLAFGGLHSPGERVNWAHSAESAQPLDS